MPTSKCQPIRLLDPGCSHSHTEWQTVQIQNSWLLLYTTCKGRAELKIRRRKGNWFRTTFCLIPHLSDYQPAEQPNNQMHIWQVRFQWHFLLEILVLLSMWPITSDSSIFSPSIKDQYFSYFSMKTYVVVLTGIASLRQFQWVSTTYVFIDR